MTLLRNHGRHVGIIASLVAVATAVAMSSSATPSSATSPQTGFPGQINGQLPLSKIIMPSVISVNLNHHSATLPLHEGMYNGETVWYILTEASDEGEARYLNINFAPKLVNMAVGCPACVQDVTLTTPSDNKFGESVVNFQGIPDFSPTRVLTPGPHIFPPSQATPGAVGDTNYSPFIRVEGSSVIYNAPIVAVGDGPFDVVHHTNTADRVLKINPAKPAGPGEYYAPSVEMLMITGFNSGQPIVYISTESSDALTATLERATYVPLLANTSFMGSDDFLGTSHERIFPFVNGQVGNDNPQSQGFIHLIEDGHASEDASLGNTALIKALKFGGDAHNVLGDFPTLSDPHRALAYSPLWEVNLGQWTHKAIRLGLNTRQTDEIQILNLAKRRPDLLTGLDGTPFGSSGIVVNCPVVAFTAQRPVRDLVDPVPGAQLAFRGSFAR